MNLSSESIVINLKLTSISLVTQFIGKVKGRALTNILTNLEKSFIILKRQINKEKDLNNFEKLSFLALYEVSINIIQEIKVESYSKNKDFDPIKYLKNYEMNLQENDNKNNSECECESEYDTYDSDSDSENDEEYVPTYIDDTSEDTVQSKKRNYMVSSRNTSNKKLKLDLEFIKSLNYSISTNSYKKNAIDYFAKFDKTKKHEFLNKLKLINDSQNNNEPDIFKIINIDLPIEQKNSILTEYINIENSMSDKSKLKTWLNNILKLPFGKYKGIDLTNLTCVDNIKEFIKKLKFTMNTAVFGHDEAKKKIIEIMAQYIRNNQSKGTCIGIWGPPGNGKTTLIKEGIAKAMNRSFIFISLGGASDASFLEGHSYTYEGSIYGRIAQGLMNADCMNPIIYFDELDKISKTSRGQEITNLLVHLTDPVQNSEFVDKYFYNVKLDLSKATFIFSYNNSSLIDPILKDRITQVETKYLLTNEKINIAQNYMLPLIIKDMGLKENDILISDNNLKYIINEYTLEGGVRKLKSILYSIARQINILHLTGDTINNTPIQLPITLQKTDLNILLEDYSIVEEQLIHKESKVGVINGLFAMTLGIGGILPIESMWIPSDTNYFLKKTGSLESVIKESIDVANTLAWHYVDENVKLEFIDNMKKRPKGIHLHCPDGATPKDGPSAGTALTVLFYSRFMNKKIKNDIAITGEINLQGMVTKIGGLEAKLEGAKRAGVKVAIIPTSNMDDLNKIKIRNPTLLDETFKVINVDHIEKVFEHVFTD